MANAVLHEARNVRMFFKHRNCKDNIKVFSQFTCGRNYLNLVKKIQILGSGKVTGPSNMDKESLKIC